MVRPVTLEEIPELTRRMEESGGEVIDLHQTPCWVAEKDGRLVGMLALRLVWQFEPMMIFPEVRNKATRRRACWELYRTAETWVADPERNGTGIFRAFMTARRVGVRSWALTKGWLHQYKRAPIFTKVF